MTDRELLENVRTKALAYEFSHRWGVLEICRRYEKALQEREERASGRPLKTDMPGEEV